MAGTGCSPTPRGWTEVTVPPPRLAHHCRVGRCGPNHVPAQSPSATVPWGGVGVVAARWGWGTGVGQEETRQGAGPHAPPAAAAHGAQAAQRGGGGDLPRARPAHRGSRLPCGPGGACRPRLWSTPPACELRGAARAPGAPGLDLGGTGLRLGRALAGRLGGERGQAETTWGGQQKEQEPPLLPSVLG